MVERAWRIYFLPEKRVVYGQLVMCTKETRYFSWVISHLPCKIPSLCVCVPLSVHPSLLASLNKDSWIPPLTFLDPFLAFPSDGTACSPNFRISGPSFGSANKHTEQSRNLVPKADELHQIQCGSRDSWSYCYMSWSHSEIWLREIQVHMMQFCILLGGRNGSRIWVNNTLRNIILWQYLWGDCRKPYIPLQKCWAFWSCCW